MQIKRGSALESDFSFEGFTSFFDVLVGLGRSRAILSGYDYGGWWDRSMEGDGFMSVRARVRDVLALSRHTCCGLGTELLTSTYHITSPASTPNSC